MWEFHWDLAHILGFCIGRDINRILRQDFAWQQGVVRMDGWNTPCAKDDHKIQTQLVSTMNKKHFSTQMAKEEKDSNYCTPNPQGPPPYFDLEPNSQPPSYGEISSKGNPHRSSAPASAASIAAILGPTPEKEQKRTWADRWKDLKSGERYGGKNDKDIDRRESSSRW